MDHSDQESLECRFQNQGYNPPQNQGKYRYAYHRHVVIRDLIRDRNPPD